MMVHIALVRSVSCPSSTRPNQHHSRSIRRPPPPPDSPEQSECRFEGSPVTQQVQHLHVLRQTRAFRDGFSLVRLEFVELCCFRLEIDDAPQSTSESAISWSS